MTELVKTEGGVLVPASKITVQGVYQGQIIRAGRVIDEFEEPNLVVNEGLNNLLSVYFNGGGQTTTWYMSIFENNWTPLSTTTAATIAGVGVANEISGASGYTSATRPEYVEAAPSSQSISNSASRASFVFNTAKTVYGAFLISNSTKGGTTGVLFSAARFSAAKAVESGDELLLTYTFTASSV